MTSNDKNIAILINQMDTIDNIVINANKKENIDDIYNDVIPFIQEIFTYLINTSITAKESNIPSNYVDEYIKNSCEQAKKIENLLRDYLHKKKVYRIPSIFSKNCPRKDFIENLQLIVSNASRNYKILVHQRNLKNKDNSSILMQNKSSEFIGTPTFKNSYRAINITLPLLKITHKITSFFKVIISLIFDNLILTFLLMAIVGVIWFVSWSHNFETEPQDTTETINKNIFPYDTVDFVKNEIITNGSKDLRSIINSTKNNPNSKLAQSKSSVIISLSDIKFSNTVTRNACLNLLDNYELFYKDADLDINGVDIKNRVNYSNRFSDKHTHPYALFCKDGDNTVSLRMDFNKVRSYHNSSKSDNDRKNRIVDAKKFYSSDDKGKRHFEMEHKAIIYKDIKELNPNLYQEVVKLIGDPNKAF